MGAADYLFLPAGSLRAAGGSAHTFLGQRDSVGVWCERYAAGSGTSGSTSVKNAQIIFATNVFPHMTDVVDRTRV